MATETRLVVKLYRTGKPRPYMKKSLELATKDLAGYTNDDGNPEPYTTTEAWIEQREVKTTSWKRITDE